MDDSQDLKELRLQREMANLRADFAEYACGNPLSDAFSFLLHGIGGILNLDTAFCAVKGPRGEQLGAPFRYSQTERSLLLSEKETRSFLQECSSQSSLIQRRHDNAVLTGVSFFIEGESLGALGLMGKQALTSMETALLQDLASTTARFIVLKQRQEVNSYIVMAVEAVREVVVITALDGSIEYVNPAFERSTGYSKEEALGQNPRLYKSGKHDRAFYKELWSTLLSGKTWHGRLINRRKDGTLFDEEASITPVCNKEGEIIKYFCVKRDITEKLSLERQLWQSQKMDMVGTLAGGMAHDYNNSLGVVLGFVDLAQQNLDKKEVVAEAFDEIRKAAEHSAAITSQLLTFARKQVTKPVVLSICSAVRDMTATLQRLLGERVNLLSTECDKESKVCLDPNQLQQILTNLCLNAREAMNGRGTIGIAVGRKYFSTQDLAEKDDLKEGTYVYLSVQDDGCGMSKETIERIFEPFFSTKATEGNGLGMSSVYGIVKQSKGFFEIDSELGKGTRISVYFPRVSGETEVSKITPVGASSPPRKSLNYHILLVEDDPGMLKVTSRMLSRLGCTAVLASSAEEALTRCREATETFDLLLTDVILPQANGAELSRRVRELFPHMATLFVSGYTDDIVLEELAEPGVRFLKKPFTLDELGAEVALAVPEASGL